MYWYDYVNPYRSIRKLLQKKQITSESCKFLPAPYDANKAYFVLRMQDDVQLNDLVTNVQQSTDRFEASEKLKLDIYTRFQQIKPAIESLGLAIPYSIDSFEFTSAIDNHVYETMQNLSRNNIDCSSQPSICKQAVNSTYSDVKYDYWIRLTIYHFLSTKWIIIISFGITYVIIIKFSPL